MKDEPHDFNPLHEPMDTRLIQLERELFSLTPVETPRCLTSRLSGQLLAPQPLPRISQGAVVPFRWRRIVVPAAAAVVVVSVLNRMEGSIGSSPSVVVQPGLRSTGSPIAPVAEQTTGYVLRAEPVYFSPAGLEEAVYQYYIQSGNQSSSPMSLPRRQPAVIQASFH